MVMEFRPHARTSRTERYTCMLPEYTLLGLEKTGKNRRTLLAKLNSL